MLGLGPVGAAFFALDHGCKRGNIRVLGVFSDAAPPISTVPLILFGPACLSIAAGAALAAREMFAPTGGGGSQGVHLRSVLSRAKERR